MKRPLGWRLAHTLATPGYRQISPTAQCVRRCAGRNLQIVSTDPPRPAASVTAEHGNSPARPSAHGLGQLLALPGLRRLLLSRLLAAVGDGAFQGAVAGAILFDPTRQTSAADIAAGFAVLLIPYSLIGPFAGALLDRWSRRHVLVLVEPGPCGGDRRARRPAGRRYSAVGDVRGCAGHHRHGAVRRFRALGGHAARCGGGFTGRGELIGQHGGFDRQCARRCGRPRAAWGAGSGKRAHGAVDGVRADLLCRLGDGGRTVRSACARS